MKYMGSKRRIAKHLLPIILKDRHPVQWYVEPFCGGCNMIDKVDGNRLASDVFEPIIAYFKALQDGWEPPKEVSESLYNEMKQFKDAPDSAPYPLELMCYAGFQLSYGAMWVSTYRRDKSGVRNYALEAYNNSVKQVAGVKDILFRHQSYDQLDIPDNSIIYCDPPYQGTTSYKGTDAFDHAKFWSQCRQWANDGHKVFVSEYTAPDDFECVWSMPIRNELNKSTCKTEKLFVYNQ